MLQYRSYFAAYLKIVNWQLIIEAKRLAPSSSVSIAGGSAQGELPAATGCRQRSRGLAERELGHQLAAQAAVAKSVL